MVMVSEGNWKTIKDSVDTVHASMNRYVLLALKYVKNRFCYTSEAFRTWRGQEKETR